MRVGGHSLFVLGGASVLVLAALAADLGGPSRVEAQVKSGDFILRQGGTQVGWVYSTANGTKEWWAYIDGAYDWADASNPAGNPWRLEAEHVGSPSFPNYAAWKAHVLSRPAAQGRTIVFQRHDVEEESVSN